MIGAVSAFLGAVPTWGKVLAGLAIVAVIVGGLWRIHYVIDKGGYDRAMSEVAADAAKRDKTERINIIETEKRYEGIKTKLRAQGGRDLPVSPVVGFAIGSLPEPSGRHVGR